MKTGSGITARLRPAFRLRHLRFSASARVPAGSPGVTRITSSKRAFPKPSPWAYSATRSFLGIPIYIGIRRILRPALIEDRAVRQRAQPRMIGA